MYRCVSISQLLIDNAKYSDNPNINSLQSKLLKSLFILLFVLIPLPAAAVGLYILISYYLKQSLYSQPENRQLVLGSSITVGFLILSSLVHLLTQCILPLFFVTNNTQANEETNVLNKQSYNAKNINNELHYYSKNKKVAIWLASVANVIPVAGYSAAGCFWFLKKLSIFSTPENITNKYPPSSLLRFEIIFFILWIASIIIQSVLVSFHLIYQIIAGTQLVLFSNINEQNHSAYEKVGDKQKRGYPNMLQSFSTSNQNYTNLQSSSRLEGANHQYQNSDATMVELISPKKRFFSSSSGSRKTSFLGLPWFSSCLNKEPQNKDFSTQLTGNNNNNNNNQEKQINYNNDELIAYRYMDSRFNLAEDVQNQETSQALQSSGVHFNTLRSDLKYPNLFDSDTQQGYLIRSRNSSLQVAKNRPTPMEQPQLFEDSIDPKPEALKNQNTITSGIRSISQSLRRSIAHLSSPSGSHATLAQGTLTNLSLTKNKQRNPSNATCQTVVDFDKQTANDHKHHLSIMNGNTFIDLSNENLQHGIELDLIGNNGNMVRESRVTSTSTVVHHGLLDYTSADTIANMQKMDNVTINKPAITTPSKQFKKRGILKKSTTTFSTKRNSQPPYSFENNYSDNFDTRKISPHHGHTTSEPPLFVDYFNENSHEPKSQRAVSNIEKLIPHNQLRNNENNQQERFLRNSASQYTDIQTPSMALDAWDMNSTSVRNRYLGSGSTTCSFSSGDNYGDAYATDSLLLYPNRRNSEYLKTTEEEDDDDEDDWEEDSESDFGTTNNYNSLLNNAGFTKESFTPLLNSMSTFSNSNLSQTKSPERKPKHKKKNKGKKKRVRKTKSTVIEQVQDNNLVITPIMTPSMRYEDQMNGTTPTFHNNTNGHNVEKPNDKQFVDDSFPVSPTAPLIVKKRSQRSNLQSEGVYNDVFSDESSQASSNFSNDNNNNNNPVNDSKLSLNAQASDLIVEQDLMSNKSTSTFNDRYDRFFNSNSVEPVSPIVESETLLNAPPLPIPKRTRRYTNSYVDERLNSFTLEPATRPHSEFNRSASDETYRPGQQQRAQLAQLAAEHAFDDVQSNNSSESQNSNQDFVYYDPNGITQTKHHKKSVSEDAGSNSDGTANASDLVKFQRARLSIRKLGIASQPTTTTTDSSDSTYSDKTSIPSNNNNSEAVIGNELGIYIDNKKSILTNNSILSHQNLSGLNINRNVSVNGSSFSLRHLSSIDSKRQNSQQRLSTTEDVDNNDRVVMSPIMSPSQESFASSWSDADEERLETRQINQRSDLVSLNQAENVIFPKDLRRADSVVVTAVQQHNSSMIHSSSTTTNRLMNTKSLNDLKSRSSSMSSDNSSSGSSISLVSSTPNIINQQRQNSYYNNSNNIQSYSFQRHTSTESISSSRYSSSVDNNHENDSSSYYNNNINNPPTVPRRHKHHQYPSMEERALKQALRLSSLSIEQQIDLLKNSSNNSLVIDNNRQEERN